MDLKLLRTFVVVARHQHFHEASRRLFLSQPTVSKHVRQLEEILDCRLFERNGKQVRLTPSGRRFLPEARRLLDEADALMHSMASWRQGYDSSLVIAASPIIARTFLPYVLHRYAQDHPRVELTVNVTESSEIAALVGRREVDLGLSRSLIDDSELNVTTLYEDPVVLVAPPDGGDIDSPIESWESLLDVLPIISHNHPGYWEPLLAHLQRLGVRLRLMKVSQIDITVRFVQVGLGVSFLPESAVRLALEYNQLQQVPAPDLELPVAASYLLSPSAPKSGKAVQEFVSLLHRSQLKPGYA